MSSRGLRNETPGQVEISVFPLLNPERGSPIGSFSTKIYDRVMGELLRSSALIETW